LEEGWGVTAYKALGLGLSSGGGGCIAKGICGFLVGGGGGVGMRMLVPLPDFLARGLSFACDLRSASARCWSAACCAMAVQVLSIIEWE
jgi:hypothetical protein